MSPSKYVQEAVRNCEIHLKEHYDGKCDLLKESANPFDYHYEPEVDVSCPLDEYMASYYQSVIGIMRCMIELERIDITNEVSMLSSNNAYPRKETFEAALRVMSYLKGRQNSRLALDPRYTTIDYKKLKDNYCTAFYEEVK